MHQQWKQAFFRLEIFQKLASPAFPPKCHGVQMMVGSNTKLETYSITIIRASTIKPQVRTDKSDLNVTLITDINSQDEQHFIWEIHRYRETAT